MSKIVSKIFKNVPKDTRAQEMEHKGSQWEPKAGSEAAFRAPRLQGQQKIVLKKSKIDASTHQRVKRINTLTHQQDNASMPLRVNASACPCINSSKRERLHTSTTQRFNASARQRVGKLTSQRVRTSARQHNNASPRQHANASCASMRQRARSS